MAQRIKMLAAKTNNLSFIPRTYSWKENQLLKVILRSLHVHRSMHVHMHTHEQFKL